jgi:hypothetical protein
MKYDARELRIADLLALILVGFGLVVAVLGPLLGRMYWTPCGIALTALGAALNVKVRRIQRNDDRED